MKLKKILLTCFVTACLLTISLNTSMLSTAQEPTKTVSDVTWTAENSDPNLLGWMEGSPPPPDKMEMILDGGKIGEQQIVPEAVITYRLNKSG